jgi:hypothetical protein
MLNIFRQAVTSGTTISSGFKPSLQPRPKRKLWEATDKVGADIVKRTYPIGSNIILDTLNIQHGFKLPIKGRYAEVLVPFDEPEPELPEGSDPAEWKPFTVFGCWTDAFDDVPAMLRQFICEGEIVSYWLAALYQTLSYRKEIQAGQIAVLKLHPFQPQATDYGEMGRPVAEVIGLTDRSNDIFGPPIIRPPTPVIRGPAPMPQLVSPENPLPEVAPPEAAPPEAAAPIAQVAEQPVNDPLARFRPAAGRSPY